MKKREIFDDILLIVMCIPFMIYCIIEKLFLEGIVMFLIAIILIVVFVFDLKEM